MIQLTTAERESVNQVADKILNLIKTRDLVKGGSLFVSTIKYKMSSGEDAEVDVYYSDTDQSEDGSYDAKNLTNLEDNIIIIQKHPFAKADNSEPIKRTLTHELIHAKDPKLNHKHKNATPSDKPKGDKQAADAEPTEEEYYSSNEELLAFGGQLNEAIIRNVQKWIKANLDLKQQPKQSYLQDKREEITNLLKDILLFFSGRSKKMSKSSKRFITGLDTEAVTGLFSAVRGLIKDKTESKYKDYIEGLQLIKQHNPKNYQRFLKSLYATVKRSEENVNNALRKFSKKPGSLDIKII